MKVYADKLAPQLTKSLVPIYIISGDEPLLVQESCDLIRQNLMSRGYSERELFHVEGAFNWEEVLFSANSMSLFADKKLLELRIPNGKPGDKGTKALSTYIENPPVDTVMLLVLPKLDAKVQRAKWFKALESVGLFIQVWPIEVAQMHRWINDRFRKAGLKASSDAVRALIDRIEGNLLAAIQEIERLKLVVPGDMVDVDHVIVGVANSARFDVFGLIDAAVGQDAGRSLRIVHGLRAENTDMLFISIMFSRELRGLVTMAEAISHGQSIDAVIRSHRVWPKRKTIVGRCLKQQSAQVFQACLRQLGNVDHMVKGIRPGDPWHELEGLALQLAGRPAKALETVDSG